MHPYGPVGRAVLHVDADAFFCQVQGSGLCVCVGVFV